MIDQLLEKRNLLAEIAITLYGEAWLTNSSFWGSPTEKEMSQVEESLHNLGWKTEITPQMEKAAEKVLQELLKKGVIKRRKDDGYDPA